MEESELQSAHRYIHHLSFVLPFISFLHSPSSSLLISSSPPLWRDCCLLYPRMTTITDVPTPCSISVTNQPPHVLTSGAGLAGLFLGILLEKAGIPYDIYERATEIKPIGKHLMVPARWTNAKAYAQAHRTLSGTFSLILFILFLILGAVMGLVWIKQYNRTLPTTKKPHIHPLWTLKADTLFVFTTKIKQCLGYCLKVKRTLD